MKSLSTCILLSVLATLIALPQTLVAQLLPEQRLLDFQNLAALYAKRYAPYEWKRQALGFDLFDLKPWLDRVRNAKDDLEFFEIEAEYVGKLQDTHSGFSMNSTFRANLGITADIYDGKVLIDTISPAVARSYPFRVGDEIVSVDGVTSEAWIRRLSAWRQYGNPVTTRRVAAGQIVSRSQTTFPRAPEIGSSANVEILRENGVVERYTIPWIKSGLPITTVGPVPLPRVTSSLEGPGGVGDLHNYKLSANDLILQPLPWLKDENGAARAYVNGVQARTPIFASGFPTSFVQRLGRFSSDFQYSGTYVSGGLTIGYLRIPSFSPISATAALFELKTEIDYFQKNTDGLIVDVMRNPGGGCYMIDVAAALIPYPFYSFAEQLRVAQVDLTSLYSYIETMRLLRADPLVIDTYQVYYDEMKAAFESNRGMTDPIPACPQSGQSTPLVVNDNLPAAIVYTKPLIVLIDEFSISAADIFPTMIQDNGRALLAGARSSGGGGSVSAWYSGFYSESVSYNTNSLVVRKRPIASEDYPTAPYVENIGARPDVPLNYMTRENLLNGGRTFVDQFTQVLVSEIRKQPGATPFAIANRGGASWTTPGPSGAAVAGYGRLQATFGRTAPSGFAILGFRSRNVLVSETGIAATPLIQSGRIYAEIGGSVNTGVAIANPNSQPATVQFYFTGADGNVGSGTMTVPANGQIAKFLDEAPFNAAKPLVGAFTFSSSAPVAVIALRGLTNERGEFLMTTLPVSDLSGPASTSASGFPHFADGGGWTTQISLVNPTDSVLTGTVQFFDPAGGAATLTAEGLTGSSFNYSIPARASQRMKTSGSPQSVQSGSVRVVPAGNSATPTGVAIYSYRKNNITVSEGGVPATGSGAAFRLYAEASGDLARGLIGSIQTGLAISNPSNAVVTVLLELTRLDGSPTGLSGTVTVPANGQVSRFLYQIPGLASVPLPFQGVLRISSTSPVSAIGLRGRLNERKDFLITAMPPANEAATPASADLFFPHIIDGGGYTTQFILFSGSPGQQPSGTLSSISQSGNALHVPLH